MTDSERPSVQIHVPVLAGIGNAIMAVPLVRALGGRLPGARITVAARTPAIAECFEALPEVGEVVVLGSRPLTAMAHHRRLARRRPDVYVIPFPSNRWQYAFLAATSGASTVVTHDYPIGRVRAGRFLPALLRRVRRVTAVRGLHDVRQNLRLAEALGLSPEDLTDVERPVFPLQEADRQDMRQRLDPGDNYIALQPGCGDTLLARAKRWPAERFAELADALGARGERVIIIEGPDERGLGRRVAELAHTRPRVVELAGPLKLAAALLEQASLYVGNDSGLAHVASAVGRPAVTLFAAADPARAAPFGCERLVVTPRACNGRQWQPRLLYPMDATRPKLRDDPTDWARQIELVDVLAAVERALSAMPRGRVASAAAGR